MNKEIPVFLFNGFLDSGKTTLIKEIIESDKAYQGYNTLIIATEDGEVEYDSKWIKDNEVYVEIMLDDEYKDDLYFYNLFKKYQPKQIVIELNAFVDFSEFKFPRNFVVYQEVCLFDASKFELYYNNMKPIINKMVAYATLVVFNRTFDNNNLAKFRRNIRAFNQNCDVAFENKEGKLTTILNEDLPYNINSDLITIEDKDFPILYLDITECFDKYIDKTLTFNLYVREVTPNTIVVGRQIMTCCADDIQFFGFECLTDEFVFNNSFIKLTCKPIKHYSEIANHDVIMLKAIRIEKLEYVEEEYLEFS